MILTIISLVKGKILWALGSKLIVGLLITLISSGVIGGCVYRHIFNTGYDEGQTDLKNEIEEEAAEHTKKQEAWVKTIDEKDDEEVKQLPPEKGEEEEAWRGRALDIVKDVGTDAASHWR